MVKRFYAIAVVTALLFVACLLLTIIAIFTGPWFTVVLMPVLAVVNAVTFRLSIKQIQFTRRFPDASA